MTKKKTTKKTNQLSSDQFIDKAITIRGQLVEKINDITIEGIDIENAKLLKEVTAVLRELDKMIRENRDEGQNENQDSRDFFENIINNSIINDEIN